MCILTKYLNCVKIELQIPNLVFRILVIGGLYHGMGKVGSAYTIYGIFNHNI